LWYAHVGYKSKLDEALLSSPGPFAVSRKKISIFFALSLGLHAACLFSCAHITLFSSSITAAEKKISSPSLFESIPAAKERALHKTLNRFFPFLQTQGNKGEGQSHKKEPGAISIPMEKREGSSMGEDLMHLINLNATGPDIMALSSGDYNESLEDASSATNFPFDAPLTLEPADITKRLISSAEKAVGDDGLDEKTPGIDLVSSTLLLAEENAVTNPFDLESKLFDRADHIASGDKKASLFEKQLNNTSDLPAPTTPLIEEPPELFKNSSQIETPHLQIESRTLNQTDSHCGDEGLVPNEHFHCKSTCFQLKDSPLYAFSVELTLSEIASFESLPQEVYFLIDRSHSIEKRQFDLFKRAISHTLGLLPKKNHFNLCVFDNKVTSLDEDKLVATRRHLIRAKTFLIGQDHGGLFASTDVFKAIEWATNKNPKDALCTAILLTDGDTFLSPAEQMDRLYDFTKARSKNFSLFTVASGQKNNLGLMKSLAELSLGHLVYEPSLTQFERTFATFVKSIARPIAKEVTLATVSGNAQQKITWLSPTSRLPIMYAKKPYVLYGYSNEPVDFTLFIHAQGANGPMTIKKNIEMKPSHSAPQSILQEVELQEALKKMESAFGKRRAALHEIRIPIPKQTP